MKKLLILQLLILANFSLYAQEKVILKHALMLYDMLEVSLEISDKPNDNFNLIKIDTLIIKDGKGDILQKNSANNTFTKANVLARYEVDEKKKIKNLDVSGVIKYFKPTKSENSYFDLGKIKNLQKHVNLIDKGITVKNPDIYFSIVDSVTIKKVFPDFKYRTRSSEAFKKLDFKSFDLIYAYKANNKQDFVVAVNGDIDPGFNSLTLSDKTTGIKYKLISIKREMSVSEKADIQIELMIENVKSIHLLPFDFKKIETKE